MIGNLSRECPVSLKCSPTAVSDAFLMLSCSLSLFQRSLPSLRYNLFHSPCSGFRTLPRIFSPRMCGFWGIPGPYQDILSRDSHRHMTKLQTQSLDKESARESKACTLQNPLRFLIEKLFSKLLSMTGSGNNSFISLANSFSALTK